MRRPSFIYIYMLYVIYKNFKICARARSAGLVVLTHVLSFRPEQHGKTSSGIKGLIFSLWAFKPESVGGVSSTVELHTEITHCGIYGV